MRRKQTETPQRHFRSKHNLVQTMWIEVWKGILKKIHLPHTFCILSEPKIITLIFIYNHSKKPTNSWNQRKLTTKILLLTTVMKKCIHESNWVACKQGYNSAKCIQPQPTKMGYTIMTWIGFVCRVKGERTLAWSAVLRLDCIDLNVRSVCS